MPLQISKGSSCSNPSLNCHYLLTTTFYGNDITTRYHISIAIANRPQLLYQNFCYCIMIRIFGYDQSAWDVVYVFLKYCNE